MPNAPQEPGRLNVSFVKGDAWAQLVDFSTPANIIGYTFASGLYATTTGDLVQAITCTVTDAAAGQVNLSLTAAQTAAIPAGTYEFRMAWGPTARRVYEGFAEVLP
jgi:hypothetical protein